MRLVKDGTNFDFVRLSPFFIILSLVLTLTSLGLVMFRGLNYGIDFAGGTLVELKLNEERSIADIREEFAKQGFEGLTIQAYGSAERILVRLPVSEGSADSDVGKQMAAALEQGHIQATVERVEFVGPQMGDQLKKQGVLAMIFATLGILLYITFRFEFRFGLGGVVALIHDVTMAVGVFALTQKEFSLPVLAAVLTIAGYSLNDTVVVFDRIREDMRKMKKVPMRDIINHSTNAVLNRTLMTSLTTLLVLTALYVFGGEAINGFALALLAGIIVGTYSSIYVAAPIVLWFERFEKKDKDGEKAKDLPRYSV